MQNGHGSGRAFLTFGASRIGTGAVIIHAALPISDGSGHRIGIRGWAFRRVLPVGTGRRLRNVEWLCSH